MKIWYVLRWGFRALLAELHNLKDMMLTDNFYLTAEAARLWIEVNPETVSLDANNVQKAPLSIRLWSGEGSEKTALSAYLTLRVESVVGSSVSVLYTYSPTTTVSSYSYTIPASSYPTANRISVYAYEDAARSKEIGSKQVNIVVENPVPFPRPEDWAAGLRYKNGEYLLLEDVIYMWVSRVPGNTTVSPKADLSSSTPSGKWKSYQNWPLLATNIALIKFGLIGSAVFKDEYMYSQQGKTSTGAVTNDYRQFGTDAFTPNLMLDFLRGRFKGREVEVEGSVITPYSRIKLEPNIPLIYSVSGRVNAYIDCEGYGTDSHTLFMPSAQDMRAGTEVNLFYFVRVGRVAPVPYIKIYPGNEEFLPNNVTKVSIGESKELQLKVVRIGPNETDKRWLIVNA